MNDYDRVADAISYISEHFRDQPSLEEVASHVNMSMYHFQRLFTQWAGVSPKKLLEFVSLDYAKQLLRDRRSIMETSYSTGMSGSSRLHDLFVSIDGMTPGQFKSGGAGLQITYDLRDTRFGVALVAATTVGICRLSFVDGETGSAAAEMLRTQFPGAELKRGGSPMHDVALRIFSDKWHDLDRVRLHLKATPFQLQVWQALLRIPFGTATTYGDVAEEIGRPRAARAVAGAIAANPVAFLIPCHRVLRATGALGGYRWGETRKSAIIGWEAAARVCSDVR